MHPITRINQPGITGPQGHTYGDPKPSPGETAFQVDNTSEQYYKSAYFMAHKHEVQPIPPSRMGALPYLNLADFLPANVINAITQKGEIVFHSVGDTGAAKSGPRQSPEIGRAHV